MNKLDPLRPFSQRALVWTIALTTLAVSAAILGQPLAGSTDGLRLAVGESAPQDILAPRPARYLSAVLTERAQAQAAAAVPDIYDPPDGRVARQQVLLLRDVLDFISTVRADSLATPSQQLSDLLAIRSLTLTPDSAQLILNLTAGQWASVQAEALSVLEQIMRSQVRADQVEEARRSAPARVSVSLSESQAEAVSTLVGALVTPNSFFNEAATLAAREAARQNVTPIYRELVLGEAIVARGRVVTEADLEALNALGLLQPDSGWPEAASGVVASLIAGGLLILYIQRFNPEFARQPRYTLLLGLLLAVFLLAAKLMVPGHILLPYLFPGAALAMLVTVVAGPNLAILVSVTLAALAGYLAGGSLELTICLAASGLVSALSLGRGERVNQFFWAGLAGAAASAGVVLVFRLNDPGTDGLGLTQLLLASALNGAVSASMTLAGFFLLGGVFDITTSLQLLELSRPDHPLLQFVLRQAPGTYQHSLQVSNLAEQAAERIGADTMLIRVGALYHDAGKALHPQYFVENQLDNVNVHEALTPTDSAAIIIRHVTDGLDLARRHRLPSRIRDFIAEHHGTLRTMFQYQRALKEVGGDETRLKREAFRYPGPRPQSKETALLMLADGCEAKARSDRPQTEEDIDRLVRTVTDQRVAQGQLDDTSLTLRDLQLVRESFVTTLKGVYHPRIRYPEPPPPPPEEQTSTPAPARPR